WIWLLILLLNLFPALLYSKRFIPCSPIKQWHELLQGGPEQRLIKSAADRNFRVREKLPGRFEAALPGVTAMFYGIHMLNGYATFIFERPGQSPLSKKANFTYTSLERGQEKGVLTTNTTENVRFTWAKGDAGREISILGESYNQITLHIGAGPAGEL